MAMEINVPAMRLKPGAKLTVHNSQHAYDTSGLDCANRSCGPPKPGRLLLSGVRRCRRRSARSRRGPGGPVGPPECPVWVRTSIVHRYGTAERPVEPRQVPSCQNRVPTETRQNPIWPERTRRASTDNSTVPYWCTTDIRTHTGP